MSSQRVSLTSIEFHRFKAMARFAVSLREMNILVGPNNCGKSTVIGALRTLAVALRSARVRAPGWVKINGLNTRAYTIPDELIPISLENVHTDYADEPSWIDFRLSNGNSLQLRFPEDGGCVLVPETAGRVVATAAQFKQAFPISILAVPVLGPVEHREVLVERATVVRGIETHRAPRHFRSYWFYNQEQWKEFVQRVAETWPGMGVEELTRDWQTSVLSLFCLDGRISRELYWAGFGFQVWCQLLTHILRAQGTDLFVVDEPEIYLHADVQRQFLGMVRTIDADVVLATHSSEIVGEAEPAEILLIDKSRRKAERLRDVRGLQGALNILGSVHNVALASIARHGRVLFVENDSDFVLIRQLAGRLGLRDLAAGVGLAAVATEGFGNWTLVEGTGWGLAKTFDAELALGCVLDSDFRCRQENEAITAKLGAFVRFVHIHSRKEIENFLLIPGALTRAAQREVDDRVRRGLAAPVQVPDLGATLIAITDTMQSEVFGQYIGQATKFLRGGGADPGAVAAEMHAQLSASWSTLTGRLVLCPGKEVLKLLREFLQREFGISLTNARIVAAINRDDVEDDLRDFLLALEAFRVPQSYAPSGGEVSDS